MNIKLSTALTIVLLGFLTLNTQAQDISAKLGKGVQITADDSSFYMKFNTRIQSLYVWEKDGTSGNTDENFLIRRARLKFEGWVKNPKIKYKIELGQSTRDIGLPNGVNSNSASIILDAVAKYEFAPNWEIWFGQTKLPGNIERVISSQSLQFVDRSNLNSRFNIDRDQGVQLRYKGDKFRWSSAWSIGEGRNDINDNKGGKEFTSRIELLPWGGFDEYKSSAHKRPDGPQLMLAATYDYHKDAWRQRGNLGSYMGSGTTLATWFVDAHFKAGGFSTMIEYANKKAPDGPEAYGDSIDPNLVTGYFYTGEAINIQAGYLTTSNFELAARYTAVNPEDITNRADNRQYTFGLSRYIKDHTVKIQTDFTILTEENNDNDFMFRLQVEVGI